jgi:hypothetical protein
MSRKVLPVAMNGITSRVPNRTRRRGTPAQRMRLFELAAAAGALTAPECAARMTEFVASSE